MPVEQVPIFVTRLRRNNSISAKALEFTILCAARTGETLGARWDEIKGDFWVVPAGRMKVGASMLSPLANQPRPSSPASPA